MNCETTKPALESLTANKPPVENKDTSESIESIESLLVNFPMIRLAQASDNHLLLEFNRQQSMKSKETQIFYERGEDFFEFYRMSGDQFWTFLFLNPDGSLGGFASFIRQWRFVRGELHPVAYFCDLRISPQAHRQVHRAWRRFYSTLIEALPSLKSSQRCVTGYTAIFDSNDRALRALTEKLKGVQYTPIQKYKVRDLLLPMSFSKIKGLIPMIISDEKAFEFIKQQSRKKDLSLPLGPLSHENLQRAWPNWEQYPFLAIAQGSEILAVTKPYINGGARQIHLSGRARDHSQTAINGRSGSSRSGSGHYVSKNNDSSPRGFSRLGFNPYGLLGSLLRFFGRPTWSEREPLQRLEMTLLTFQEGLSAEMKSHILRSITSTVQLRNWLRNAHTLSFTFIDSDLRAKPPFLGIGMEIDAQIYEVHSAESRPLLGDRALFFEGAMS